MRWLLYSVVLGTALMVPLEKNNVGNLQPMEAVYLKLEGEQVVIRTDTGDQGAGETMTDAVKDLHNTAPGIVYMDTADYLIVNENAKGIIEDAAQYLKPSVRMCMTKEDVDLMYAAKYLNAHKPNVKLCDEENYQNIERLSVENNYLKLKENA